LEDFFGTLPGFSGTAESGRQLFPGFPEHFGIAFHLRLERIDAQFVALGIDQGEGDAFRAEFRDEVMVDLLEVMPCVKQHEKQHHLLAVEDVVADDVLEFLPAFLAHAGVAIAGQVHEVPGIIDQEMVDKLGLAGGGRSMRQPVDTAEAVDQGGFSDIAPSDEGEFRMTDFRLLVSALAASGKGCLLDDHECVGLMSQKYEKNRDKIVYLSEMAEKDSIGLLALQERVKNALDAHFSESLWLRAEINELKQHPSGHCYLTLVEKDADSNTLMAKASAVAWASSWRMIRPYFETQTGRSPAPGMQVLIRVQVSYSVLYGLSLVVYDIDPSFTVGELELARQRTIARLEAEGMFGMNSQLELPLLPRRLAVVTSETAAGWRDFQRQLANNEYGFRFQLRLFPALMQGDAAPESIIAALDAVAMEEDTFDAVLILRGGGGAMDLVCFDDYELAVNVAQFPLPVLTAIGHDHDYHIIDRVAHTQVKTPTALADWLIDRFAAELWQLDTLVQRLHLAIRTHALSQTSVLDALALRILHAVQNRHAEAQHQLDRIEQRLDAVDPRRALERGFLLALKDGRRVDSAIAFTPGDHLTLLFRDGRLDATVTTITPTPDTQPE